MNKKMILCCAIALTCCLSSCNNNNYVSSQTTNQISPSQCVSILKIEKTKTEGNVDTYTITYTDGSTSTFTVTNGENGEKGEQGIQGIQGQPGKDGHTPVITIVDGYWYIDGVNSHVKAEGIKGDAGNGIVSIVKTDSIGLNDIYTITYTDGSTSTFTITNGENGESAYEIYIKYHPEYTGTEKQWIHDFISGRLESDIWYTVSFDSNGGTSVESQQVMEGRKAKKPEDPIKEGYVFDGWYLNEEPWSFIGFDVTDDITLVAKWREDYTEGLAFYPLSDDTYAVGAGYAKYLENIVIPSYYNEKKVTKIIDHGFENSEIIKSIILPNTLVSIEEYAFNNCKNLTINVPSSVQKFGKYAFFGISNLTIENESEWEEVLKDCSKYQNIFHYEYQYIRNDSSRPDKTVAKTVFDDFHLSQCVISTVKTLEIEYSKFYHEAGKTDVYREFKIYAINIEKLTDGSISIWS